MLIGQDTELFVKKNDKFVSAYGLIPGSKINPYPVKKGAVQIDGMALEFNTKPAKTLKQFRDNINIVLSRLYDMIPKDYEVVVAPVANFSSQYIKNQPIEATQLGCESDYNAYTGLENTAPNPNMNMRTAAGHVHLGWTDNKDIHDPIHFESCRKIVKQLDFYLGLPSIINEQPNLRRQMYGRAGAFRPKSYGVEYRVLSNFWITTGYHIETIFMNSHKAYDSLKKKINLSEKYPDIDIEDIINNNKTDNAWNIMRHIGIKGQKP